MALAGTLGLSMAGHGKSFGHIGQAEGSGDASPKGFDGHQASSATSFVGSEVIGRLRNPSCRSL